MVLSIETSDNLCAVAFTDDGQILTEYQHELPFQHAALVGHLVQQGITFLSHEDREKTFNETDIHLVAVAIGPGSFTGLRIGLSYAQGFCFGRNIPIVGISNHQVLASFSPRAEKQVYTVIEARQEEVYLARHLFLRPGYSTIENHQLLKKSQLPEAIISPSVLICHRHLVLPEKTLDALHSRGVWVINSARYSAAVVAELGVHKFRLNGADNLSEIEPLYIRPFAGIA